MFTKVTYIGFRRAICLTWLYPSPPLTSHKLHCLLHCLQDWTSRNCWKSNQPAPAMNVSTNEWMNESKSNVSTLPKHNWKSNQIHLKN
jgi:hypothetical protein